MATRGGLGVKVDPAAMGILARDLRALPVRMQARVRRALAEAGVDLAGRIRSNASWSSRIPNAVSVSSIVIAGKDIRTTVTVDGAKAPEAAPLENQGRPGRFRRPVYGYRDRIVEQDAHPFIAPAVLASTEPTAKKVLDAIDQAAKDVHL